MSVLWAILAGAAFAFLVLPSNALLAFVPKLWRTWQGKK